MIQGEDQVSFCDQTIGMHDIAFRERENIFFALSIYHLPIYIFYLIFWLFTVLYILL